MASENEKDKSAENCSEMEKEGTKTQDERLADDSNSVEAAKTAEQDGNLTKDDNLSDQESESFEDAVEELNERINDVHVENERMEEEKDNCEVESEDEEYVEPSEPLTEEEKLERSKLAEGHKAKGNEYFKRSEFPEARVFYTTAIKTCPHEFKNEKSIFYSNRAACLVRMELYEGAIKDTTKALELNPEYLKARLRRAQCYEHEDKLEEALEDYQKVLEADMNCGPAREAVMRLPEQIKVKHEKMKEEMLGKLKDLGNVFLKPFGLSTNNFQVQQDPNTGGYSVNFQQK